MCNPLHFRTGRWASVPLDCSALCASKIAPSLGAPSPGIALDARGMGTGALPIPSARLRPEWRQGFAAPRSSPGPACFAAQAAASGRALDPEQMKRLTYFDQERRHVYAYMSFNSQQMSHRENTTAQSHINDSQSAQFLDIQTQKSYFKAQELGLFRKSLRALQTSST